MLQRGADRGAGRGIPEARGAFADGENAGAVRAECGESHRAFVVDGGSERPARERVPNPRVAIVRGGDDALAVVAECGAVDGAPMRHRLADDRRGGRIPDAHFCIGGDRQHTPAIAAEDRAGDRAAVWHFPKGKSGAPIAQRVVKQRAGKGLARLAAAGSREKCDGDWHVAVRAFEMGERGGDIGIDSVRRSGNGRSFDTGDGGASARGEERRDRDQDAWCKKWNAFAITHDGMGRCQ